MSLRDEADRILKSAGGSEGPRCPECGFSVSRVLQARSPGQGDDFKRRRECLGCGTRFTTYEAPRKIA
jgi:transcriptional regulator NrdR family protein